MTLSLAYLGPIGTHSYAAASLYCNWLAENGQKETMLCAYPSISQTLKVIDRQEVDLAIVPVENSTEGSVTITLDTLWQLKRLQIQQELVLPIQNLLFSWGKSLEALETVYSHPQPLAQCQKWLQDNLTDVQLIPTNSTTEALQRIHTDPTAGAIASPQAAKLYDIPILAEHINDYPDNCTRFWIIGLKENTDGHRLSLAFSVPQNVPGALMNPLAVFARRNLNLSRIESRPTKRSLGEYLFFLDLEGNLAQIAVQEALQELSHYTEETKILGSYDLLEMSEENLATI